MNVTPGKKRTLHHNFTFWNLQKNGQFDPRSTDDWCLKESPYFAKSWANKFTSIFFSGLAAAYKLKVHGMNVTVFEADGRAGGKLRSISQDGLIWDEGANTMVCLSIISIWVSCYK